MELSVDCNGYYRKEFYISKVIFISREMTHRNLVSPHYNDHYSVQEMPSLILANKLVTSIH